MGLYQGQIRFVPGTILGSPQGQPDQKIYVYVPFSCLIHAAWGQTHIWGLLRPRCTPHRNILCTFSRQDAAEMLACNIHSRRLPVAPGCTFMTHLTLSERVGGKIKRLREEGERDTYIYICIYIYAYFLGICLPFLWFGSKNMPKSTTSDQSNNFSQG